VLLRAVDAAPELSSALGLLADFAPALRDPAARESCQERQAELLRLSGRLEEARVVLLGLPETPARLVERASLDLQMGLTAEAEQLLGRVRDSGEEAPAEAARFLLAELYLATERTAQGEADLRALIADRPASPLVPGALLALGESLRGRGEAKAAGVVLDGLRKRFPDSPEAALADSAAGVRYAASPLRLLPLENAPPAELPRPPLSVPGADTRQALVQAGSFREADNAQYLVRDLNAHGFEARVMEKTIGEALYFRVVVGQAQSPEQAQALILRLKDAGYEGVLLLE
jgi:cell division septation protein DedD